ncbi:MAG: hypothetical protein K2P69_15470, partial [Eubacterium sp.]|nr:hypothetical protein [Eubacterium sp.]
MGNRNDYSKTVEDMQNQIIAMINLQAVDKEILSTISKSKKVKMPKPELYVIFTGNKGWKPDKISLSKEFFEGADIDIEVKAKVIYERDTDD